MIWEIGLKTVADAINHCIRKTDKLVRYGGDEFFTDPSEYGQRHFAWEITADSGSNSECENSRMFKTKTDSKYPVVFCLRMGNHR